MNNQNPVQSELLQIQKLGGPVTCLGMTFVNDEERRSYFIERLQEHLKDPAFRAIEGFPIGEDEDILALSDPPYYTACPNPFLPQIIAEWQQERQQIRQQLGLPNDSNNGYHREPFATDVSEGKTDRIYQAHGYHTKVPHKAIMRYLLHYTDPGDITFDGFCGTGMAGVAAQLYGDRKAVTELGYRVDKEGNIFDGEQKISRLGIRKTILNDLSPAATFIAYNYNTPVDVPSFEREARRILQEIDDEWGWMYETLHPDGKTKCRINYTVWSEVFTCPNCAEEIVFAEEALDSTMRVLDEFPCPHCATSVGKRMLSKTQTTLYDDLTKSTRQILFEDLSQSNIN
jgi:predicted RNA-binding Zn-ribbon protein involved in translation (DUF1610 family)